VLFTYPCKHWRGEHSADCIIRLLLAQRLKLEEFLNEERSLVRSNPSLQLCGATPVSKCSAGPHWLRSQLSRETRKKR
jgi:hypothetical protein